MNSLVSIVKALFGIHKVLGKEKITKRNDFSYV